MVEQDEKKVDSVKFLKTSKSFKFSQNTRGLKI